MPGKNDEALGDERARFGSGPRRFDNPDGVGDSVIESSRTDPLFGDRA